MGWMKQRTNLMKITISKNDPTFFPSHSYAQQEGGGVVCVRDSSLAILSKASRNGMVL